MIPIIRRPGWRLQPRTAVDDDLAPAEEALRGYNRKICRISRMHPPDPGQPLLHRTWKAMPAILLPCFLSRLLPEPDAKGMRTVVRREPFRSRAPPARNIPWLPRVG